MTVDLLEDMAQLNEYLKVCWRMLCLPGFSGNRASRKTVQRHMAGNEPQCRHVKGALSYLDSMLDLISLLLGVRNTISGGSYEEHMVEVSEVLGYLIEVRVRMQRKAECYRPVRHSQHNRCNTFHIFSIDFQSSHLTSFTITHTICEMASFPCLKSPFPRTSPRGIPSSSHSRRDLGGGNHGRVSIDFF